ncbi:hypothetical protein KJ786_00340 [Patescibacteria group bacterium]|nr:hypothetical protein [Patescibacteria group bacterium]
MLKKISFLETKKLALVFLAVLIGVVVFGLCGNIRVCYADSSTRSPTEVIDDDSSGGTFQWTNPENAELSDNAYAVVYDPWQAAWYNSEVIVYGGGISEANWAGWLENTSVPLSEAYISFGDSSYLPGISDPTAEQINASNFGVIFGVCGENGCSHYLNASNFGFSIPTNSVINGIKVEIEEYQDQDYFYTFIDHIQITVYYSPLDHFALSLASSQQNDVAFSGTNTLIAQAAGNKTIIAFNASENNVTLTSDPADGTISGLGSGSNNVLNQAGDFVNGIADLTSLGMKFTGTTGSHTFTATSADSKTGTSGVVVIFGAATKLGMKTQPREGTVTMIEGITSWVAQPELYIQDANGITVTNDNSTQVTATIGANPGGGTLSGTTTVTAVNGVVTFSNLIIDKVGTSYTLSFTSNPALTGITSSAFNIVAQNQIYPTNLRGDPNQAITGDNFSPQLWYYNGKTYFLWMQRIYSSGQYGIDNFVAYYDHETEIFSPSVSVGAFYPDARDVHGHGNIMVTSDGYILVAHEKLNGPSNHQSPFLIKRSVNPEDISSFEQVASVGSELSYPHFYRIGDRIFLTGRNLVSKLDLSYTDNSGTSWSTPVTIVDFGSGSYWAYTGFVQQAVNDKIRIVINMADKTQESVSGTYKIIYYLESVDGNIFTNIDGSYSHNVSVNGALTKVILDANYVLRDSGTYDIINGVETASLSPEGRVFFVIRENPQATIAYPWTKNTKLRYYDGASWVEKSITPFDNQTIPSPGTTFWYNTVYKIFAYSNTLIDLISTYDVNGVVELQRYRSSDAGDTWSKVEDITSESGYNHLYTQMTGNASEQIPLLITSTYQNGGTTSADIRVVVGYMDAISPTNVEISSIIADSSTQLTIIADTATDSGSGLHATPYQFQETTGNTGATSSGYQELPSYTDVGLSSNTQYTYKVRAKDANSNESDYSSTSSKYTLANVPSSLSLTADSGSQVTASWSANSNPTDTSYYIENTTAGTNSDWVTDVSWSSAGLSCGKTYSFRVKAKNGDSTETEWTDTNSVDTSGCGGGGLPVVAYNPPSSPTPTFGNPQGGFKVLINNGDESTNNLIITLNFTAGSDTVRMAISNFSDFRDAIQEPFQSAGQWTLSKGEGIKAVYVKFYTQYGQSSEIISSTIVYEEKKSIVEELKEIPKKTIEEIKKISEKIKEIIKPKEIEEKPKLPPVEEIVLKEAPLTMRGKWQLLPPKPINEFVLTPLPKEIRDLAEKFPELGETLKKIGITKITDIEKLKTVKLTLPGLTERVGLPTAKVELGKFALPRGIPLAELSSKIKKQIPTEIVFAKTGGQLIDFNIALSITEKGEPQQKITTISDKPLQLMVKPDKSVKSVKGYIIFKSKKPVTYNLKPEIQKFQVPSFKFQDLTASLIFATPIFVSPAEPSHYIALEGGSIPENKLQASSSKLQGTKLVLLEFEYTDPDGDGIYTAEVQAPIVEGEYEIITVMDYDDPKLATKETRLITVVDPEGYVYEKDGVKETRIPGAIISLFWLNPETKQYELWSAKEYQQENPQTTDVRGTYFFLVPEGFYYLKVEAPGYLFYDGKPFQIKEGSGVHINIELKTKYWWLRVIDWKTALLIILILLIGYNFYRDKIRDRIKN